MNERFGYCGDCMNKGMCAKCYRGTYYESGRARFYGDDKNQDYEY